MVLTTILAGLLYISLAEAVWSSVAFHEHSVTSLNAAASPPLSTVYYFDQLIDHDNAGLGTFQQRYWINLEFYKTGGPVILVAGGEGNAESSLDYLTDETICGMVAQQQQGATVLLEHRFFGYSNPYNNLTSQSLEVLTIQQAIDDLVYFAQNVNLPMPGGDKVKPDTTPWVLMGGSYSGALVSWTMVNKPGVFHAGYASSAVVQAIDNFYGYFTPILEYMPQNCSSDVQAVIAYLDSIYTASNTTAMQDMKEAFGLGALLHIDDFAAALQLNLWDWQNLQLFYEAHTPFFQFCDALEVKDGENAPVTGWGLEHAISAWGSFWKNTYYSSVCTTTDVEACLGTYNGNDAKWTNTLVNNAERSWAWIICNQLGFYKDGPPEGQPAIASRIVQQPYYERQCVNWFPDRFSSPPSPSISTVNSEYAGWSVNVDRLFFATGRRDPWREATVSAEDLDKANTTAQPIYESDGFHVSDMRALNGQVDDTIRAVQNAALEYMKMWLA